MKNIQLALVSLVGFMVAACCWDLPAQTPPPGDLRFRQVSAGASHNLAIGLDGTLWAWGLNSQGQLGDGTRDIRSKPAQISTATDWKMVAAGNSYSLAVKTDGTLWAWGVNNSGQLGDGTTVNKQSPFQIDSSRDWDVPSAGGWHSIAIKTNGTLWTWGSNNSGQLGDGTTVNRLRPVQIGLTGQWKQARAGGNHCAAIKMDGTLWAWGENQFGLLGDGSTTVRKSPVQVGSSSQWRSVATGLYHNLGIQGDGTLWSWGSNSHGQLGNGAQFQNQNRPVLVGSATNWEGVSAGSYHTVAKTTEGTLWAWGDNAYGQLGDGSMVIQLSPKQIGQIGDWQSVTTSWSHALALRTNGTVWAWGYNLNGLLGDGTSVVQGRPVKLGAPLIVEQPVAVTNVLGSVAMLGVTASGSQPLSYQWLKDGVILINGGRVRGATSSSLVITNVQSMDAGNFSVVITNSYGSITSLATRLVVPGQIQITQQPQSQTNNADTTVTFEVLALGAGPLTYQWLKDGSALAEGGDVSGTTQPALALSHVFSTSTGNYSVIIKNSSGSVTSAVARLVVNDPAILSFPVGLVTNPGWSAELSVTASGSAPLIYQWYRGSSKLAGCTNSTIRLEQARETDAGAYSVVVGNQYGSVTSSIAILTVNLAASDNNFNPFADSSVSVIAIQADGKIVVGGGFTMLSGVKRSCIGRLNANGSLDTGFNPGAGGPVRAIAIQPDGKIVVGGEFRSLGNRARSFIGRLNPDGTLDEGFAPGASYYVQALALQADGKIVVGGEFTVMSGKVRNSVARLHENGVIDNTFDPNAATDYPLVAPSVYTLAIQPDGKVLVGGAFKLVGGVFGVARDRIARFNADGTLDAGFNPGKGSDRGEVRSLVLQRDGKILASGYFAQLGGQYFNGFARLNTNGTIDTEFNPDPNERVHAVAVDTDQKILVGGEFNWFGAQRASYLGRLNADGSSDCRFGPRLDEAVYTLALQADGKILAGGGFSYLGLGQHVGIGRLINTDPAQDQLACSSSTITWQRGGTCPEVWRCTFEYSADGTNWTMLGNGTRSTGPATHAWELTGLTVPSSGWIRGRGFVGGGSVSWFVETVTRLTVPLQFVSTPTVSKGMFYTKLMGATNGHVILQFSGDLAQWTSLGTQAIPAGGLPLSWPVTTNWQQFFRARWEP